VILFRKARRRHPGVYVYLTRRHLGRGVEVGYVGKSNFLELRKVQHESKPWADLVVGYHALRLPWWLGWQWVTLSLETLVILVLRPRYNWQKNPRRSKTGPRVQALQRAARDELRAAAGPGWVVEFGSGSRFGFLVPALAVAMIVVGGIGWFLNS
jgi:hypothetical protein